MFQSANAGTPLTGLSNIVASGRQPSQLETKPSYIHNTQPLHHEPTEPREVIDFEARKAVSDSENKKTARKTVCKKGKKRCYSKRKPARKPTKKKPTKKRSGKKTSRKVVNKKKSQWRRKR
jgi:hypothetical protein